MSWEDLLDEGWEQVLPWYGFRKIHNAERTWTISGNLPPEHGWYLFKTEGGRKATLLNDKPQDINPSWAEYQPLLRGYLVGGRLIPDNARVDPNPANLVAQTIPVFCTEMGLDRFARASVVRDREGHLVYVGQEFPQGPEAYALQAFQDKAPNIDHVANVTPALDLAFRWISYQREQREERRRKLEQLREEEERKKVEEERLQQAMRDAGTAVGRRVLATRDFETAAKEALKVSGAELLDVRDSYNRGEKIVQYRFRQRRLECVVDMNLRIINAGFCLVDEETGVRGDTWLTLESLPSALGQAIDEDKLIIWRHA